MSTFEVDLVKDSTMKMIAAILAKKGSFTPLSYKEVQSITQMGLAPYVFNVGDIIEVARETSVQASLGAHTGITNVTVSEDKFVTAMAEAGTKEYEFVYDGSAWKYSETPIILTNYGLSVSGTPAEGDTFLVIETADVIEMVIMDFITPDSDMVSIKLHDKTKKYGIILQSKYLVYSLQFDAKEAFFSNSEELAAGTYHFKLGAHTWVSSDVGKFFKFTTTQTLPAGAQLYFNQAYNATLEGATVNVYASGASTTPIETVTLSEGSDGTNLGVLDNTLNNAGFNCCQRALFGSNRWETSAIRQHLNSEKPAGSVWAPRTVFDRPPLWAASIAGWMHGLDPGFVGVCADVELLTALNYTCDTTYAEATAGTGYETTTDKFFVPSRPEVFGGGDTTSDKGTPWAWYKANSDKPDASYNGDEDSNRVKTYKTSGTTSYWWLRSPYAGNGCTARIVSRAGAIDNNTAYISHGVPPACIIA